ncbi:MAG TPA: sigma-70 family RNA polymerase sigma factor [bacterium]|nr:sigma-70 family RNA polymerase sigma factor [bacterium]HOH07701.1 sigma-70 family RNA polymerase sigma factor [bacterium]HOY45451.1 sigma-70 family RNA polymerase sigma factor [bacterium]HPG83061.1 sigma-70 family RNA polymerase sigma factor [bacterium]HPM60162.1 sigma-70 family RNA polymerase sigma factor [bacterium]
MIELQEAELVSRCRNGDDRAFAELVSCYQKPVYNLALRITRSGALAEEVTQSTFVKVYERFGSFKTGLSLFSWIYRIAMNEAINEYRRGKRRSSLDETRIMSAAEPSFELAEAIQEALMQLKPDDRALIVLRHFQNLGYREIAVIMDRSESRIKSQLFRARSSLKIILARLGVTNEE